MATGATSDSKYALGDCIPEPIVRQVGNNKNRDDSCKNRWITEYQANFNREFSTGSDEYDSKVPIRSSGLPSHRGSRRQIEVTCSGTPRNYRSHTVTPIDVECLNSTRSKKRDISVDSLNDVDRSSPDGRCTPGSITPRNKDLLKAFEKVVDSKKLKNNQKLIKKEKTLTLKPTEIVMENSLFEKCGAKAARHQNIDIFQPDDLESSGSNVLFLESSNCREYYQRAWPLNDLRNDMPMNIRHCLGTPKPGEHTQMRAERIREMLQNREQSNRSATARKPQNKFCLDLQNKESTKIRRRIYKKDIPSRYMDIYKKQKQKILQYGFAEGGDSLEMMGSTNALSKDWDEVYRQRRNLMRISGEETSELEIPIPIDAAAPIDSGIIQTGEVVEENVPKDSCWGDMEEENNEEFVKYHQVIVDSGCTTSGGTTTNGNVIEGVVHTATDTSISAVSSEYASYGTAPACCNYCENVQLPVVYQGTKVLTEQNENTLEPFECAEFDKASETTARENLEIRRIQSWLDDSVTANDNMVILSPLPEIESPVDSPNGASENKDSPKRKGGLRMKKLWMLGTKKVVANNLNASEMAPKSCPTDPISKRKTLKMKLFPSYKKSPSSKYLDQSEDTNEVRVKAVNSMIDLTNTSLKVQAVIEAMTEPNESLASSSVSGSSTFIESRNARLCGKEQQQTKIITEEIEEANESALTRSNESTAEMFNREEEKKCHDEIRTANIVIDSNATSEAEDRLEELQRAEALKFAEDRLPDTENNIAGDMKSNSTAEFTDADINDRKDSESEDEEGETTPRGNNDTTNNNATFEVEKDYKLEEKSYDILKKQTATGASLVSVINEEVDHTPDSEEWTNCKNSVDWNNSKGSEEWTNCKGDNSMLNLSMNTGMASNNSIVSVKESSFEDLSDEFTTNADSKENVSNCDDYGSVSLIGEDHEDKKATAMGDEESQGQSSKTLGRGRDQTRRPGSNRKSTNQSANPIIRATANAIQRRGGYSSGSRHSSSRTAEISMQPNAKSSSTEHLLK